MGEENADVHSVRRRGIFLFGSVEARWALRSELLSSSWETLQLLILLHAA